MGKFVGNSISTGKQDQSVRFAYKSISNLTGRHRTKPNNGCVHRHYYHCDFVFGNIE